MNQILNLNDIPIEVRVIVTAKNDKPAIELRRATQDADLIKFIIGAALKEQPIVILPRFYNKMQSLNSLVEKGIIYRENDAFYFTF